MSKIKQIFTNFRVLIALFFLVATVIAIYPNPFREGAAIRSVVPNSSAAIAGISSPVANAAPMSREFIAYINNIRIKNSDDYYNVVNSLKPNITVQIRTNKAVYKLIAPETTMPNSNVLDLGIRIYDAPTSNIRKGLDLQGGTRTILKPEANATEDDISMTIDSMKQRLNVYGLSDVVVKQISDLSGQKYVLIEIAGAYEDEVRQLIAKQGKFEAKIANDTIFIGGKDITYVCRTADCSGIDPNTGCNKVEDRWYCRFRFSVSLSPDAAQRQANATQDLAVVPGTDQGYLNETLDLFLDNQKVDSLNIAEELKGKAVTDVAVSGSGAGSTKDEAIYDSLKNMKRLQTILITGSLPITLEVVKTDSISPVLGEEVLRNTFLVLFVAILTVSIILFGAYRKPRIAGIIMLTGISELVMTVGFLTLIGWNIDLAAIAGLITAVGAGIDDQIVMTDEALHGERRKVFNWKEKIRNAFYIITGGFFTNLVAMFPLLFAGAGMLKGFAITTIVGITIGILITRPAYAEVIQVILKD